jgi:hypothetical protein
VVTNAPHLSSPELHPVFETLGYALGFGAYKYLRNRSGDVLGEQQRWSVIAAAMLGALIGNLFYRDGLEQSRLAPLRQAAMAVL